MRFRLTVLSALSVATVLAACSGGGGGGGSAPGPIATVQPVTSAPASSAPATSVPGTATPIPTATPSATPAPTATPFPTYVLPSPGAVSASQVTIDSQPHGLAVTIDGVASGVTPATAAPGFAASSHTVTVMPSSTASPYVVTFAQQADGPHAIFYNQTLDVSGKILSVASMASARVRENRRTAAVDSLRRMPQSLTSRPAYATSRLEVRYDLTKFGTRGFDEIERSHGIARGSTVVQSGTRVDRVVTLAPEATIAAVAAGMRSEPGVAGVNVVALRYPLASTTGPVTPNDPFYVNGDQWYVDRVDATDAWGYGYGQATTAIAVIDTGYDPLQTEIAPAVMFSERIVGGTLDTAAGDVVDHDGHGTWLSGIAAAATNNGVGFASISNGALLQEYKVFTDGASPVAESSDVAEAIRQAVAHGAKVVLLALGGTPANGPDPFERDAVDFALSSGVTVIAGSGDDGIAAVDDPAAYDGVISVGASSLVDNGSGSTSSPEHVAAYSNYGPGLSLVAPGGEPSGTADTDLVHYIENVYTTQPSSGNLACPSGTVPSSCELLSAGTSPAAAIVAGGAALAIADMPSLTPAQIASVFDATSDDIADPNEGAGRFNLHRAIAAIEGDTAPAPPQPTPATRQFVAFAYTNHGGTSPTMIDVTYPHGVPVGTDGTFRIGDLPMGATGFRIAVWYDANGDGIVDAGDEFAATAANCSATGPCSGTTALKATVVASGFTLP